LGAALPSAPLQPAPGLLAPPQPTARILLVPLDDRPATTQFAQMIGRIAGATVETPPPELLGRFTTPGEPDGVLTWLRGQDLGRYCAVLVSTDMVAYGGLIASRLPLTDYRLAIQRLRALQRLRRDVQQAQKGGERRTRFFAFSAIMRLSPTATRANGRWRLLVARHAEAEARFRQRPNERDGRLLDSLRRQIPAGEIERFEAARARNHLVQQELLRMTRWNVFDYLILGQDDAQPMGPHVAETRRLKAMARNLGVTDRVYFCEGIDQHSNVLVSRALALQFGWRPRVRVVYTDDLARDMVAHYEADRIEASLKDQIVASGARLAQPGEGFDYTLFVNTPRPRPGHFEAFVQDLRTQIDQGEPVAVADINLGAHGTGSPELFDALNSGGRVARLLSYAGWNTAGNTMGTAIPAANVYLLARRANYDPLRIELARRAFLLHRLVNDFEYHRFTRPAAYALQDRRSVAREESYGSLFDEVNDFVRQDVQARLDATFRDQFQGRRFFAGHRQYEVVALAGVDVALPWPRAYEVRIGFELHAEYVPVAASGGLGAAVGPMRLLTSSLPTASRWSAGRAVGPMRLLTSSLGSHGRRGRPGP
jgi:hypothetical protein